MPAAGPLLARLADGETPVEPAVLLVAAHPDDEVIGLVQAGGALAERHVADAGRLLRPGGGLVILNFSYRGIGQDQADLRALAQRHGFALVAPRGSQKASAMRCRLRRRR